MACLRSTKRYARAPAMPPRIGATQNIQSCANAQPPTKIAGPVLRAGFTEVLVTGMPTRWIRVSAEADGDRGEACGRPARIGGAHDHEQEDEREDDLGDDARFERVAARRVLAVAVGREAAGEAEARRAAGDDVQHGAGEDRAGDLHGDVRHQLGCRGSVRPRDSPTDTAGLKCQPEMWPIGIDHRQHGEAEGQRDAERSRCRGCWETRRRAPRCRSRRIPARTYR